MIHNWDTSKKHIKSQTDNKHSFFQLIIVMSQFGSFALFLNSFHFLKRVVENSSVSLLCLSFLHFSMECFKFPLNVPFLLQNIKKSDNAKNNKVQIMSYKTDFLNQKVKVCFSSTRIIRQLILITKTLCVFPFH